MSEPEQTPRSLREELEEVLERAWVRRMGTMSPAELGELAKASTLSDAEADAALEQARREVATPATVHSLAEAKAKAQAKRQRPAWLVPLAAAAAVLLLAGGTYEWTPVGRQIDAWLRPAPTTPVPLPVPPTHEETPQEKAAKLREMALVDIQKGYMGDATDELDAAETLDPAGARTEAVVAMRQAILDAQPRNDNFVKPPTGPTERPLIPKKWHLQ